MTKRHLKSLDCEVTKMAILSKTERARKAYKQIQSAQTDIYKLAELLKGAELPTEAKEILDKYTDESGEEE